MSISILLADDQQMVRDGLRILLEQEGLKVIGEASDGHEAIQLVHELSPDVAVLELSMPLMNGISVARALHRDGLPTRIIVLTVHAERQYVLEALRAGIKGYVLKSCAAEELVRAIREVMRGCTFLAAEISDVLVEAYLNKVDVRSEFLSPRELQVLQLIAEGKSTKEAAGMLNIGSRTAETHRSHIMRKLELHNTASLVRYAVRRGLTGL